MNWRKFTAWGMLGLVVVVIAWDVFLGATHQDTESQIIAETARSWAILPFLLGALIGHWLVNRRDVNYALWPWALASAGLVLAFDLVTNLVPVHVGWLHYPGIWAAVGIPAGSFLWPQKLPGNWPSKGVKS